MSLAALEVVDTEVSYVSPAMELPVAPAVVDDEWVIAAPVAAFLGISAGLVYYVCGVCQARSFWSCVSAMQHYFSRRGC